MLRTVSIKGPSIPERVSETLEVYESTVLLQQQEEFLLRDEKKELSETREEISTFCYSASETISILNDALNRIFINTVKYTCDVFRNNNFKVNELK